MTDRQREIVHFVHEYRQNEYVGPTYTEIADNTDCSRSKARDEVLDLIDAGVLERKKGVARSIRVADDEVLES